MAKRLGLQGQVKQFTTISFSRKQNGLAILPAIASLVEGRSNFDARRFLPSLCISSLFSVLPKFETLAPLALVKPDSVAWVQKVTRTYQVSGTVF